MSELGNISGKTFLITGGASGLGAGIAEALLKEGAKKVALLDIAEDIGNTTADKLNKSFPESTIFIQCDVSSEKCLEEAFDKVTNAFETLDVIVNNAGIMNDSPNIWRTACDVNLQGVVSLTLKGLKYMRKDEGGKGGTIVNISSVLAYLDCPFLPIYSGCKAAVLSFSRLIAMGPFYDMTGVRILTMCFGPTDTPLLHNLETRSYDRKAGAVFEKLDKENHSPRQSPESAVKGTLEMFKHGTVGTTWLAELDQPAVDISSIIDNAYKTIGEGIQKLTNAKKTTFLCE